MTLINLTPHEIVLLVQGTRTSWPPEGGILPRVATTTTLVEGFGLPCVHTVMGEVESLPEPIPGTVFIVSTMVAQAATHRADLVSPDTGPTAIRENGQVKGVSRFQSFA